MKMSYNKLILFLFVNLIILQGLCGQIYSLSKMSDDCTVYDDHDNMWEKKCPVHIVKNNTDTVYTLLPLPNGGDSEVDIHIRTIEISNLSDFIQVIRVRFQYTACCTSSYDYYLLVDSNYEITELNTIVNTECDGYPRYGYVFPTEEFGKKEMIIKAAKSYESGEHVTQIKPISTIIIRNGHIEEHIIE